MKLTGREGKLRILDSSLILHDTAPLETGFTVDVVTWDGVTTWANITSECIADDVSYASNFLADNGDAVFIGSTERFAMFRYYRGGAVEYAVSSGLIRLFFFDGTNFATEILAAYITDGTKSGGDCFAQDGYVSFRIPHGWKTGANGVSANLDSNKYYIKVMCTTSPSTDPDADILCPIDGQQFEVLFANMDFDGPLGRPLTEEQLVLNRGKMDSDAHYVKGPDDVLFEPLPVSFSCILDDTANTGEVIAALQCGNPGSTNWTSTGTSTKGDTMNDGVTANPAFADTNKKCVNVQMVWENATNMKAVGVAYYETYFALDGIKISESADGVILACNGSVYGVIETIYGFGNRF